LEILRSLGQAKAQRAEVLLIIPDRMVEPHVDKLKALYVCFPSESQQRQPVQHSVPFERSFRDREFAPDVCTNQGTHLWFDLALPLLGSVSTRFYNSRLQTPPGDRLSQKTPLWVEMFARRRADELIVHSQYLLEIVLFRICVALRGRSP